MSELSNMIVVLLFQLLDIRDMQREYAAVYLLRDQYVLVSLAYHPYRFS